MADDPEKVDSLLDNFRNKCIDGPLGDVLQG